MSGSKYEYVKAFESSDVFPPRCWIVIRVDGRAFSSFVHRHGLMKPMDCRATKLLNSAAQAVLQAMPEVLIAYGHSDEYSFVLRKNCQSFARRCAKLTAVLVSLFTSLCTIHWSSHFPDIPLLEPPVFDGRSVCFPSTETLRDYLCWRQADCHINYQYNLCFWALVHGGESLQSASQVLAGTVTKEKLHLLQARFGIDFFSASETHRKGTLIYRRFSQQVIRLIDHMFYGGQDLQSVQEHGETSFTAFWFNKPT
mmetsp:Transcript_4833/g.16848  ORF Transcript_4833/g.16848 Transcript_4833/m.16848 type:complete len:254 (+) Transcript_4833:403-1164(+)